MQILCRLCLMGAFLVPGAGMAKEVPAPPPPTPPMPVVVMAPAEPVAVETSKERSAHIRERVREVVRYRVEDERQNHSPYLTQTPRSRLPYTANSPRLDTAAANVPNSLLGNFRRYHLQAQSQEQSAEQPQTTRAPLPPLTAAPWKEIPSAADARPPLVFSAAQADAAALNRLPTAAGEPAPSEEKKDGLMTRTLQSVGSLFKREEETPPVAAVVETPAPAPIAPPAAAVAETPAPAAADPAASLPPPAAIAKTLSPSTEPAAPPAAPASAAPAEPIAAAAQAADQAATAALPAVAENPAPAEPIAEAVASHIPTAEVAAPPPPPLAASLPVPETKSLKSLSELGPSPPAAEVPAPVPQTTPEQADLDNWRKLEGGPKKSLEALKEPATLPTSPAALPPPAATTAEQTPPKAPEASAKAAPQKQAEKPAAKPKTKTAKAKAPIAPRPTPALAASDIGPGVSQKTKEILEALPEDITGRKPTRKLSEVAIDRPNPNVTDLADLQDDAVKTHQEVGMSLAVKEPKMDTSAELEKAYEALVTGDADSAIGIYQDVLALQPHNKLALLGLATTYHQSGALEEARAVYAKLLAIDPHYQEGLNNFLMLVGEESPMDAIQILKRLEAKNPEFSPLPAQISILYQKLGDYDQAIASLRRAVQLSPDNLVYHYNLAILYDQSGKKEEAKAAYRQLLRAHGKGQELPAEPSEIQERLTFLLSN